MNMETARGGRTGDSGCFEFFDCKPDVLDVREEVLGGLCSEAKSIPPKYFYDERGSRLFEAITRLPEYYLTRTELSVLDACLEDIALAVGDDLCVVEYGSGSSAKIRKVLERIAARAYVPVDISGEHLVQMAKSLQGDFPALDIYPTCADFTHRFPLPEPVAAHSKVGFFPGSSIGNFDPPAAQAFLAAARETLGAGSHFVVGVDLKKPVAVLESAYDDSQGVTAAFNLNVLRHLGELLDADLDTDRFRHCSSYNPQLGCVQMFLEVIDDHAVNVAGQEIRFVGGERIHTENSFKYDPQEFLALAAAGGYQLVEGWTDSADWFAVYLLEAA